MSKHLSLGLLPLVPLGLFLALGCDADVEGGAELSDSGTPDTEAEVERPGGGTTKAFGTQVGSEGLFGCIVTERTAIAGADEVPGGGISAEKAAAELAGSWALQIEDDLGMLWVDAPGEYTSVKTDACGSYVEARATGLVTREVDGLSISTAGLMGFSDTQRGFRMAVEASHDAVREVWGAPPSDETWLVVEAEQVDATLIGRVGHASCVEASCELVSAVPWEGTRP